MQRCVTVSSADGRAPAVQEYPRWALPGLVVSGAAGVVLSGDSARQLILADRWALMARLAVWVVTWVVAVRCALRLPARTSVVVVLSFAALLRMAALAGIPSTSDDVYRYSWDARVQAAGIDPYRETPSSPVLAGLRESWLWPDARGCAALDRPPGCTRINRPDARTIYPPVAQAWFRAVYLVVGIGSHERGWQAVAGLVDLGLCWLLVVALRAFGRDERLMALYALCPVVVLEITNNAHVDGLAIALLLAAVLAHRRDRPWLAGGLLGLAAMVKLYPAVILPALWRRRPVAVTGAFAAVCGLAYLPHVLAVGLEVLGYLPSYLREEHYDTGSRFLLLGLLGLPGSVTTGLAVLVVAAVTAWVVWRRPPVDVGAVAVLGALFLVATPVQPWYAVALLAVATLAAMPWWAAVLVAGEIEFFAVILDHPHQLALGRIAYALAAAAVAWGLAMRWRRTRGAGSTVPASEGSCG